MWCLEFIPGSNFLTNYPGISSLLHDVPANELNQISRVWERQRQVRQARGSISIKPWKEKLLTSDLEIIAVDIETAQKQVPPAEYSYVDWATEVDLNSAHLEGVYHWVPKASIANLDSLLDNRRSSDIYSRAKIIGFYDAYFSHAEYGKKTVFEMGLTKQAIASYQQHLLWFIENMPECQFMSTFYLSSIKKQNSTLYKVLKAALLKQANLHKRNLKIQVNVAAALARTDESITRKLCKVILALDKSWGATVLALLGDKMPERDVKLELNKRSFIAGQKNAKFLKIAKRIDLHRHCLFGWFMTRQSVWSSELALLKNPNDLVLRGELLEAHSSLDRYSVKFNGHTPDVVPALIEHNLWFIQNLPSYYMYSLGCRIYHHGYRKTDRYLGPHAILLEAAKRQTKAQPSSLSIGLAMSHYFPLGYEKQAMAVLRGLSKLFPNNKELNNQLDHLRSLGRTRATARKQLSAKKRKAER